MKFQSRKSQVSLKKRGGGGMRKQPAQHRFWGTVRKINTTSLCLIQTWQSGGLTNWLFSFPPGERTNYGSKMAGCATWHQRSSTSCHLKRKKTNYLSPSIQTSLLLGKRHYWVEWGGWMNEFDSHLGRNLSYPISCHFIGELGQWIMNVCSAPLMKVSSLINLFSDVGPQNNCGQLKYTPSLTS